MPDGAGGFPQDFSGPAVLRDRALPLPVHVRDCHALWCGFPTVFRSRSWIDYARPTTPDTPRRIRFGLIPVRSPLLGEFLIGFLSSRYLDVSVHGVRFPCGIIELPHSDTSGSQAVCAYPELFAAYHVLHSLCMPRHPPCALPCFLLGTHSGARRKPAWSRDRASCTFRCFPSPYVK